MSDSENEHLLRLLEVHGQAFLKSTNIDLKNYPASSHKRRKLSEEPYDDANEEEWHGINTHFHSHQYSEGVESEIGTDCHIAVGLSSFFIRELRI